MLPLTIISLLLGAVTGESVHWREFLIHKYLWEICVGMSMLKANLEIIPSQWSCFQNGESWFAKEMRTRLKGPLLTVWWSSRSMRLTTNREQFHSIHASRFVRKWQIMIGTDFQETNNRGPTAAFFVPKRPLLTGLYGSEIDTELSNTSKSD